MKHQMIHKYIHIKHFNHYLIFSKLLINIHTATRPPNKAAQPLIREVKNRISVGLALKQAYSSNMMWKSVP